MKRHVGMVLLLLVLATQVMADGKMYWREKVPPSIPYQRALILFKGETETLVLQSKYEIPKGNSQASLGWVVPVPSEPEIASMSADLATRLFFWLSRSSRPEVTHVVPFVIGWLLVVTAILSILTILVCALSFFVPIPFLRNRDKMVRFSFYGLFISFVIGFFFFLSPALSISPGVDVIKEQRVGIFDVKVVKSENSGDLIAWLNKNKFAFDDADKAGFDSYIKRGWCFVVANINPSQEQKKDEIVSEGLAAPLILRFSTKEPVYPVVLTGTGNYNTEILIYLASSSKMTCDGRLTLRYAGEAYSSTFAHYLAPEVEPAGFFKPEEFAEKKVQYPYLCKFRDVLTPAGMAQDITFKPAADNTLYREHITTW